MATAIGGPEGSSNIIGEMCRSGVAAAAALPFAFGDLIRKSNLQMEVREKVLHANGFIRGCKAAPVVGGTIGAQLAVQRFFETLIVEHAEVEKSFGVTAAAATATGVATAVPLAVINGWTMGQSAKATCRNLCRKQIAAIALTEGAFVGGIVAGDHLGAKLKREFGDYQAIDYLAAGAAGGLGSLLGHSFNTYATRMSGGLPTAVRQSMLGSATKVRAIATFAVAKKAIENGMDFLYQC